MFVIEGPLIVGFTIVPARIMASKVTTMSLRMLVSEECADPEVLKRTAIAFDNAWAIIEARFAHDPSLAQGMRDRLAQIILNSPASELQDLIQIRSTALRALARSYPGHAAAIERLLPSQNSA